VARPVQRAASSAARSAEASVWPAAGEVVGHQSLRHDRGGRGEPSCADR
jgi:hypothetical protein